MIVVIPCIDEVACGVAAGHSHGDWHRRGVDTVGGVAVVEGHRQGVIYIIGVVGFCRTAVAVGDGEGVGVGTRHVRRHQQGVVHACAVVVPQIGQLSCRSFHVGIQLFHCRSVEADVGATSGVDVEAYRVRLGDGYVKAVHQSAAVLHIHLVGSCCAVAPVVVGCIAGIVIFR